MKLKGSLEHLEQARRIIPLGTSTLSKTTLLWMEGVSPLFAARAEGCTLYDVDGNRYIDFAMGLGAVILGYAHGEVIDAAIDAMRAGSIFTLPHPNEHVLAEKLCELIPCAEMVRFSKNGSDVTTAAVKLARHYTGRRLVLTMGYHGCHDWYVAGTERNKGIPEEVRNWVRPVEYNNFDALERTIVAQSERIAAVIMEPVIDRPPQGDFLQRIREITRQYGIVLIFDEILTGFRFGLGGVQGLFGVIPDLATFAKAMSNGFVLSALVGKRDLMKEFEDETLFFTHTFAGENTAIAAAMKTIQILERDRVLAHVWDVGSILQEKTIKLLEKKDLTDVVELVGFPCKSHFLFKNYRDYSANEIKSFIQQECAKRGILFIGFHLPSFAHTSQDIAHTLQVYEDCFGLLKKRLETSTLLDYLEGPVIGKSRVRA